MYSSSLVLRILQISGNFSREAFSEKFAKLDTCQVRRHLRGLCRGLRHGRWRGRAREPTPTPGVASHPGVSRDAGLPSVRRASSDVHRVGQVALACERSRHVIHRAIAESDEEKTWQEEILYDRRRPKVVKLNHHTRQIDPGKSLNAGEGEGERCERRSSRYLGAMSRGENARISAT